MREKPMLPASHFMDVRSTRPKVGRAPSSPAFGRRTDPASPPPVAGGFVHLDPRSEGVWSGLCARAGLDGFVWTSLIVAACHFR